MKKTIQQVTFSAMMLAMMLVMVMADLLLAGNLLTTLGFILPLPLIVCYRKIGLTNCFWLWFAFILSSFLLSGLLTWVVASLYASLGLIYCFLVDKGVSQKPLNVIIYVVVCLMYGVMVFSLGHLLGMEVTKELASIEAMLPASLAPYSRSVLILVFLLTAFFETLLLMMAINIISMHLKLQRVLVKPWSHIKVSRWIFLVLGLVACLSMVNQVMFLVFLGSMARILLAFFGHIMVLKQIPQPATRVYSIIIGVFTLNWLCPLHSLFGLLWGLAGKME